VDYPLTAIVSDLHGNSQALDAAVADARARGARRYVCLGDVIGYGARPRACLDLVMRLCVPRPTPLDGESLDAGLCLQGNHEYGLLYSAEDFNPKARAAIDWTREELSREEADGRSADYWDFIGALEPAQVDLVAMFAHGSPSDPVREYVLPRDVRDEPKMRRMFARMQRQVCFVGHSHVPAVYYEDLRLFRPRETEGPYDVLDPGGAKVIVNVGSVGQPRDGDPRLSYALFDGRAITFVRLAYDLERAMADIRGVPALPGYLAERLALGR
jgi:diadenosine tetraphosphatase ApaH/serine/threonine PP2A family protein phosphatase